MKGNSMKNAIRTVVTGLLLVAQGAVAHGKYTETMDPNGPTKNLRTDFGLVDDDAASDQSDVLQEAIDVLAILSAGTGEKLAELQLDYPPVFNGLAAARNSLFVSLDDGSVLLIGSESSSTQRM